jgi:hypothetical protein
MMRLRGLLAISTLAVLFAAGPAWAAPPPNDDLAAAQEIAGSLPQSITGTTVEATKEPGEPNHAGRSGGASVWYRWKPSVSGPVVIETCESASDTALGVYTGAAVNALTELASNDNTQDCGVGVLAGTRSRVVLDATAGETYRIAVDHALGSGTAIVLTIRSASPPANDDFEDAQALDATLPIDVAGTNADAWRELGEPDHAGNGGRASVWYRWTPAASGPVAVDTCDSDFDTHVAIYTGDSVDALSPVASNDDAPGGCTNSGQSRVVFRGLGGVTYRIAVGGHNGAIGRFTLALTEADPPPNDDFATAEVLSGELPISVKGTTRDALKEPGEPDHAGAPGGGSVWYAWTADATAQIVVETCGSDLIDTLLAVYTGDAVDDLTEVAGNDDSVRCQSSGASWVTFAARAGETYWIAVDAPGESRPFELDLRTVRTPASDDFAQAEVLHGPLPIEVIASNQDATEEPGEPNHVGHAGGASVWYAWTADVSGTVLIDTCLSTLDTLLAVYTGDAVDALTPADTADGPCDGSARLNATAGQTYRIAVDGFHGETGMFRLSLRTRPANDDFGDAQTIAGELPVAVTGALRDATDEPGEPDHASGGASNSIWYSWTPQHTGSVVIETCESGFDTQLAVYTGDAVDGTVEVASNDDGCGEGSRVRMNVFAGRTYRIAVDGWPLFAQPGTVVLAMRVPNPPPNDNFADAKALRGALPIHAYASSDDASGEPGEPGHSGGGGSASVWYRWTATLSGRVTIETCGSDFDTVMGVYTGAAVDALTEIAVNDQACRNQSRVRFDARVGQTYTIAVDGYRGATGAVALAILLPPANDDLANARALSPTLPVAVNDTTIDASREPGEPDHAGEPGSASIWYRWTPAASGRVVVETCGSNFDTLVGVYTGGPVSDLAEVAHSDQSPSCTPASGAVFAATAGTTYLIAVDGYDTDVGSVKLAIRSFVPPGNDDFENAAAITGKLPITLQATTVDATDENGEPSHGPGGRAVWYRWTAPSSRPVAVETCGSTTSTILAVYTGSALTRLTPVGRADEGCGSDDASLTLTPRAGETYRIAVGGNGGQTGRFRLSLRTRVAPANDAFAAAEVVSGRLPIRATGTTTDASREPGEPRTGASVWYAWTPTTSLHVVIDTCGSRAGTLLGVYTGRTVDGLTEVAPGSASVCPDGRTRSRAVLSASAGKTYRVAIGSGGLTGEPGQVALTIRAASPPVNDDFATAQTLDGALPITVRGTNVDASRQADEPEHGFRSGASVWYRWTPATTGPVVVETCGSGFATSLGVYTGNALHRLEAVAANEHGCGEQSRVQLAAQAGVAYRIAVDGAETGKVELNIRRPAPPANDDLASALALPAATPVEIGGTNVDASAEPGEPSHGGLADAPVASVWYRWTPSISGVATLDACDSSFDVSLGLYTGATMSGLRAVRPVARETCGNTYERVTVPVHAGVTYRIAVADYEGARGEIALRITRPPGNDNVSDAEPLTLGQTVEGTVVGATREPGEPDHSGDPHGASVWYAWTAARAGWVEMTACGRHVDTLMAVYTGAAVNRLAAVTSSGDDCRPLRFEASAGQAYLIAIVGQDVVRGTFRLQSSPTAHGGRQGLDR